MLAFTCKDRVYAEIENRLSNMSGVAKSRWKNEKRVTSLISTYCTCFSKKRDSLPLWSEYGNKSKGVAIGFDKNLLDGFSSINPFISRSGSVIYDEDKQQEYIEGIANSICEKIEETVEPTGIEVDPTYLLKYPFVKDSSFCNEAEYRLVLNKGLTSKTTQSTGGGFVVRGVYYRAIDDNIIPYYELDFSQVSQHIIKEIIIGSRSKISIDDVYGLLYRYGYYNGLNGISKSNPYKIYYSKCTYQ